MKKGSTALAVRGEAKAPAYLKQFQQTIQPIGLDSPHPGHMFNLRAFNSADSAGLGEADVESRSIFSFRSSSAKF